MRHRTTLFYVDDNPKSSRLLTSVLEECGFRVIARNNPIEALAQCQSTCFDLALLDYEMPLMSGSRLAREIKILVRRRSRGPDLRMRVATPCGWRRWCHR